MYLVKDRNDKLFRTRIQKIFYTPNREPEDYLQRFRLQDPSNKLTCFGCKTFMVGGEFPQISTKELAGLTDKNKNRHSFLCFPCTIALWEDYKKEYGDQFKALFKVCSILGIYYNDNFARKLSVEDFYWEDDKTKIENVPWVYHYFIEIARSEEYKDKSFSYGEEFNAAYASFVNNQNSFCVDLSEKDKKNRSQVISIYHWDPFEKDAPEDKPRLYEDLITISTEGISEDLTKARAAIEIVRGYLRIDKINEALREMRISVNSMIENEKSIKTLTEQMRAETSVISTLAKENGFSEIANKMKTKGVGTLTGIVQEMNQSGFDRGIVNKFDIDTTEAMRKVAEISAESMAKQLMWTSADYADMVKEQADMIRAMQDTMRRQAEELRLLKEEHLREELLERYRQALLEKELDPEEIDRLIEQELKFIPVIDYKNQNYDNEVVIEEAEESGDGEDDKRE